MLKDTDLRGLCILCSPLRVSVIGDYMSDPSYIVFAEEVKAEYESEHEWLVGAATLLWGDKRSGAIEDWPEKAKNLLSVDFNEIYGMMPKWRPLRNRNGIFVYSDDGCNIAAVPPLIQLYLRKYHSDWYWWTEWAEKSDRPSVGSFRGGALFVTEEHVAWHSTSHWVDGMIDRLTMQRG